MRILAIIGALAVVAGIAAACQDITNPVEQFGTLGPPWVRFNPIEASAPNTGSWAPVVFQAPSRPEEDITISYAMDAAGDAVADSDYMIVADSGSTTAAGSSGTVTIAYDPNAETPTDTMWVYVPSTATIGRQLIIDMTTAQGSKSDSVMVGYLGQYTQFTLTVTAGPATILTGTYSGTISGDLGSGTLDIAISDNPTTISGTTYRYVMDDFAWGAFGGAMPWGFNVLTDGSVQFSPEDAGGNGVTANITGTYDFATNTLSFDTELTCCGGEGLTWSTTVSHP